MSRHELPREWALSNIPSNAGFTQQQIEIVIRLMEKSFKKGVNIDVAHTEHKT